MDGFKTRDKLFGHVLGKMVLSQLDEEVVPTPIFLEPSQMSMSDLVDSFYMKVI